MPLPNASPAEDSRIYQLFQGQKIEDFSADDIDKLRDTIFFQAESEDLLRRLILFGMASGQQSFSGPIARTQQIIQKTYSSTSDDEDFFVPGAGEVWQIVGGDTLGNGGTGTAAFSLRNSSDVRALQFQTSVNGQEPIFQNTNNNNIPGPIFVTAENKLYIDIQAVATSLRVSISFIRVR
tara:strand:+ start:3209 stop:3748 length:540 start_codon:yes stop_codon:yes gene_type:complete